MGNVRANADLAIPALTLEDGPQGVADGVTDVTCFPSALTVTATWDTDLMRQFGEAMAVEQKTKGNEEFYAFLTNQGTNIMLGPMHNIARYNLNGQICSYNEQCSFRWEKL